MTDESDKIIAKLSSENIRLSMLVKVLKETLHRSIDVSVELESVLLAERHARSSTGDSVVTTENTHRNQDT